MNPLYEVVQNLKNRIANGEISGPTALDLFFQHVTAGAEETPSADNVDPVPEPASEEPADGQTAEPDTE